jgi:gluconokinase
MAAGGAVLALDVGTSSVRALLYDRRARPLPGAAVRLPHRPRIARDGTAEVDPERLMGLVHRDLDELLRRAPPRLSGPIEGVGVSTFWHSLVAADAEGRTLTPLVLWPDPRSWRAAKDLARRLDPETVRRRTGCTPHASYWPASLAWSKEARPDLWRRPVRWMGFGDLLCWRLFGRPGTSLSMASGAGLLRLGDGRWDEKLLAELELDPGTLPPLAETESGLLLEFAARWPRLARVPWLHAAGDGALANLGSGCVDPTQRALTIGTSGALRTMYTGPPMPPPPGLWCYRLDAARPVVGGALSNGGDLRAWMSEVRNLDRRLEERLRRHRPGGHGLVFLPLLAGERSPGDAPHASGAVVGLTLATTAEDLAQAGLEAIAIAFARVDRRMDEVLPAPRRLVASGAALFESPAWMQVMADAIGRPVAAGGAEEASCRGAALFALERLEPGEAPPLDPGVTATFEPDQSSHGAYERLWRRQEALHELLVASGAGPLSGRSGRRRRPVRGRDRARPPRAGWRRRGPRPPALELDARGARTPACAIGWPGPGPVPEPSSTAPPGPLWPGDGRGSPAERRARGPHGRPAVRS